MSKGNVTEQHYIECATCKNYSTFYCNTCHQRLCEQCRYVHLREKENRKHQVVLYQERLKELPTEKCPVHPTKILEIFCADCSAPVCSKCFATDHNGHQVLGLEFVYNVSLQQCQKELIKIRDNILPQCIDEVNSQIQVAEEAKKKIWKVRLAIKHSADEIKSIVDSILTENNAKLDIIEASILDEKIKEQKKLKDYISYLNGLIEDYTSDLSSCQLTEIIRYNKKSKNIPLMKYPEIIEPGIPMFTNGRKIKEEIESIFGHIKPRAERLKEVETIKASIHQFNSKPYQKLSVVLSRSISKTRQFNISGLKAVIHLSPAVRSSRFWASDDFGNLIQFDMHGNAQKKIFTEKQIKGYHAVTNDDDLIYTDYIKKTVYKVNNDMSTTALVLTGDWEPRSICSSHLNGDILVGMNKLETWKITRYNKEGIKLQDIQKNEKGKDLFSSVSYLTENINGDICTSDYDAKRVRVLTGTGEYRFSYSGNRSMLDFWPHGICTDVNRNIIVGALCNVIHLRAWLFSGNISQLIPEYEFNIHLLDQDGRFLTFIPKQNIFTYPSIDPHALCVDDQNNLIAGSVPSTKVCVFKYLRSKCA